MRRAIAVLIFAACATACHSTPEPQSPANIPADTADALARQPAPNDTLGLLLFQLERELAPVRAWRDQTEKALRAYAGTARADSTLLRARTTLEQTLRQLDRPLRDNGTEHFIVLYRNAAWKLTAEQAKLARAKSDSLIAFLETRGIWPMYGEGMVDFQPDNGSLLAWFGSYVTPSTREYLMLIKQEQHEPTAGDAAIMITTDQLVARLRATEQFVTTYPQAAARPEVYRFYRQYLATYLAGTDNSRAFDLDSRRLHPDLRKSFEAYALRYGDSESGRIVAEYLKLLKANGYTLTPRVEAFQHRLWDAIPYP